MQARIERLRWHSPRHVLLSTSWAKRLVLTGLAGTGLMAIYLLSVSSEEYPATAVSPATNLTKLDSHDRQAQRDAVLMNFAVDSKSVDETSR